MNREKSANQKNTAAIVRAGLRRRYRAEKWFRGLGMTEVVLSLLCLAILFGDIMIKGLPAFRQAKIALEIDFSPALITPDPARGNYRALIRQALKKAFPEVRGRRHKRQLYHLVSNSAPYHLRRMVLADPGLIGSHRKIWLTADDGVDNWLKDPAAPAGRLSRQQRQWLSELKKEGRLALHFNQTFFTGGDSRDPESAGILGAFSGSLLTLLVTLALSFPLGVAAALYLEEFAPKNLFADFLEVNINNLAAVPSIIFGLLGLAVFINLFGLPRSAPLVGGLVLSLMTMPTIIIAGRAALKSVPPSIREAALGLGASKIQTVFHHVLPLALPGMLTGTIIGMARALGETAPLLMIGMVAFIVDIPKTLTAPATVMPVQIYLWADSPERAFVAKTSAAIIVLLAFLILMNAAAVILRRKCEKR
jgi:phosphate transport system permease protein